MAKPFPPSPEASLQRRRARALAEAAAEGQPLALPGLRGGARARLKAERRARREALAGAAPPPEDAPAEAAPAEDAGSAAGTPDAPPPVSRTPAAAPPPPAPPAAPPPAPMPSAARLAQPAKIQTAKIQTADVQTASAQTAAPRAGGPTRVLPPARPQRRHRAMLVSFVLLVLVPFIASGVYLWGVAQDQYASTFAFSVRKEETQSSLDIIGGITRLAGSATSDTDILYEFIRSQDLVARVDADLDLRAMWSRAWPDDPVFGFDPSGTIEDLHAHWLRKVDLSYDSGTGIVTVRVLAFDPLAARSVAGEIFAQSTRLINALSEEARADATGQARVERDLAFERLREARQALTAFRLRTQIVDIDSDLQGQMGLLNTLQAQLAASLIELDLQRETAPGADPRVRQAERRIEVIEARIAAERAKFGEGGQGPGGEDYARIAAEFERLSAEREFAEATYRSALATYEGALSSAQRQSRYLAAHIRPTLAEQAMFPQRAILFALIGFFLLVFWSMGVLVYYSVRDRK